MYRGTVDERPSTERLDTAWALLRLGLLVVFIAGGLLLLAPNRLGAWLVVGALFVYLLAGVVIAVVRYRRTLARPWPIVPSLPDDDDE
jgi:Ca2+/Na+ antiporter